MSVSRRAALSGLGLASLAAGLPGRAQATPTAAGKRVQGGSAGGTRPNVLVILLDDLGFADLGCYGGELNTPHMDSLARDGAQFTSFHTTAVCSATRASLLTGLNHHSAGMGWLADADTGAPGYRGDLTHEAPTLAEHFRAAGWATYHVGKWHINSVANDTNDGDPSNWPLHRGFDTAYWFHGHSSDYFRPAEMREGDAVIEIEPSADYYITDDLTDRAIADIQRHQVEAGDLPFFMYLAHAAPHTPLQARAEDLAAVRGRYDAGWDALRQQRFERQKASGLIPDHARLPERDPNVRPWADLNADEQRLHARYMETYAAVVERLDWNMGRLLTTLEETGLADDTIVVLMSDNGGSPDAGPAGTPNLLAGGSGGATFEAALDMLDELGGPDSCVGYSLGWAMASCTPYRMYKHHTFGGGVADPLLIRWPSGLAAPGERRRQYVHVVDVGPMLMAAAGITPITDWNGGAAKPIEGLSFAGALADPAAPAVRLEQYYEMEGKRAYYAGDWEIVSARNYGQPLEADRWELFDTRADFNQTTDLSSQHPERVAELEARWWAAAERYQVLPLDLRTTPERYFAEMTSALHQTRWVLRPGQDRILSHGAPPLFGRSHSIEVQLGGPAGEGVLAAHGNMFLGCVLYVRDGRVIFEGQSRPNGYRMEADLPSGARVVRVECTMAQRPFTGSLRLLVDGVPVAEIAERRTLFGRPYQGFEVGRNGAVPVSRDYEGPFAYSGVIDQVVVEIDGSAYSDAERAAMASRFSAPRRD